MGKNNGTINKHTYFTCKPKHGVLVKPALKQVTLLAGDEAEDETFDGFGLDDGGDATAHAAVIKARRLRAPIILTPCPYDPIKCCRD